MTRSRRQSPEVSLAAAARASAADLRRGPAPEVSPLLASDCPALIAGLEAGAIDPYDVQQRIVATVAKGRLWTTPEWKAVRERLIKDHCEQCGETAGPMTLQHFWHAATVDDIARSLNQAAQDQAWELFRAEHEGRDGLADLIVEDGPERPGCPVCAGYNIRERKKVTPRWVCLTTRDKMVCNAAFEHPIVTRATRRISAEAQRRQAFFEQYARRYRETELSVYTQAAVLALEAHMAYLGGADTLTFCRRCAYLWDEKGVRLCQACRDAFHPHHEEQCHACSTGCRWVTCAVCGRHRHLDKYPTCWECAGIRTQQSDDAPASDTDND